ncbi:MAG: helix-turn-helix transcriptional regulator [Actinomycetota bacterium]|nr:helix-turn-helix transcriptional regulator [Actinomycetota bacterium]
MALSDSDVGDILSAAEHCLSARTLDGFADAVLASCRWLVDCDFVTYNEVDHSNPGVDFREDPGETFSPDLLAAFLYHLDDHPVITEMRRSGSGAALRISDVLTSREFHHRGIYSDFFQRLNVEDQLAISLRVGETRIIGLAANRDRAFTDRERDRLEMLRPLLVSAYHNVAYLVELERAAEYLRVGLSGAGCDVFVLSPEGVVTECTEGALDRLSTVLPPDTVEPATVFLTRLASRTRRLRWEAAGAQWLATSTRVDPGAVVTVRRDELLHAPDLQSVLGISAREAQVLAILAQGHTSAEVAGELGISVRTVHKHLENLYRCIGVSSQREAVTIARGLAE